MVTAVMVIIVVCCRVYSTCKKKKKKDEDNKIRMLTILFLHNREHGETCWRGLPKE